MAGLTAFAWALGIVFVAEVADKTMFAVLALASRGHGLRVWLGASAAFVLLAFAAALLGDAVGDRVPLRWMAVVAGAVFIVLGVVGLLRGDDATAARPDARGAGFGAAFGLILLAEMGDRTQIAVVALAAHNGHPWLTGLGAALALVAVAAIGVVAGRLLQHHVRADRLGRVASILFIVVGAGFVLTPWMPSLSSVF